MKEKRDGQLPTPRFTRNRQTAKNKNPKASDAQDPVHPSLTGAVRSNLSQVNNKPNKRSSLARGSDYASALLSRFSPRSPRAVNDDAEMQSQQKGTSRRWFPLAPLSAHAGVLSHTHPTDWGTTHGRGAEKKNKQSPALVRGMFSAMQRHQDGLNLSSSSSPSHSL